MAAYVTTRQRNLRGLGVTYSFVPTRRGLRGLGQTDIDIVTGLPCDDPRANCGPFELTTTIPAPVTLTPPPPIIIPPIPVPPPPTAAPMPTPPVMNFPPPVVSPTIVFPSGGTVRPSGGMPPVGWMDQQILSGIPNKYLALGMVLLGIAAAAGGKGRR